MEGYFSPSLFRPSGYPMHLTVSYLHLTLAIYKFSI